MKALVALCLFVAYAQGCAKINSTHSDPETDSQPSLKNDSSVSKPISKNDLISAPHDINKDQTIGVSGTRIEPAPPPEKTDNNQFTRKRISADRDDSIAKDEFLARIAPRLSRSSVGLPVRYGSNGQMLIDLKGRFSHVSLAKKAPNGTIRHTCVDSVKGAKAWLSGRAGRAQE